jgi:(p)ppGpp synthase/HD superfamily hydrolase
MPLTIGTTFSPAFLPRAGSKRAATPLFSFACYSLGVNILKTKTYKKAFLFVTKKHAHIRYANDVPAAHHLARVSERLAHLLTHYREGTTKDRVAIVTAALGHDLLEDTVVTKKELRSIFTKKELELIEAMTNEWGDANVRRYVKKIKQADEEVRLIKLADLCDNITAVVYTIAVLGTKWTDTFFLQTVTPMKNMVLKTPFRRYQKTARHLKESLGLSYTLLRAERARFGVKALKK